MSKKVLVPLDGSEQSEKAFEFVLEEFPNENIVLLHVANPLTSAYSSEYGGYVYPTDSDAVEMAKEAAVELVEEYVEKAEESGVDATGEHVLGEPASSIVEYAEENDIDHIVIGSHGRTGVSRILLGSVAEKVVRRSPTPVTVVR